MPLKKRSIKQRFWEKVQKAKRDDCWIWTARTNLNGYGEFTLQYPNRSKGIKKVRTIASRLAWILTNGEIEPGFVVRHKCDNPRCCNPNHLELGTDADNVADRVERGRSAAGEQNGRSKLTVEQVREIRAALDQGIGLAAIGRKHGIDPSTVGLIKSRVNWKHVS